MDNQKKKKRKENLVNKMKVQWIKEIVKQKLKLELNIDGIIEEIADPGTLLPFELTLDVQRELSKGELLT